MCNIFGCGVFSSDRGRVEAVADAEASVVVADEAKTDADILQVLGCLANRLHIHSIRATCTLSSGHPTSCSSAAKTTSVLFFHVMRSRREDPENLQNDRFILCKQLASVDMAVGWLGQGLGAVWGMLYAGQYFDKTS